MASPPNLSIETEQALKVLKAMSNEARLAILSQLHQRPMNVSEIARELKISQPTITNYIAQLEDAGLVSTRIQRGANGYGKICFLLHDDLTFTFGRPEKQTTEMDMVQDMPMGHYSEIDILAPSLLASQSRIIASQEDSSRFFHPDRMEADLLFVRRGRVQYLFPYNVPDERRMVRLELSLEASGCRVEQLRLQMALTINDCEFQPVDLTSLYRGQQTTHMPAWYPAEFPPAGELMVWKIGHDETTFNDEPAGAIRLRDLRLKPMQPIRVALKVVEPGRSAGTEGGMILFGSNFGRFNQDLRLRIVHEQVTS